MKFKRKKKPNSHLSFFFPSSFLGFERTLITNFCFIGLWITEEVSWSKFDLVIQRVLHFNFHGRKKKKKRNEVEMKNNEFLSYFNVVKFVFCGFIKWFRKLVQCTYNFFLLLLSLIKFENGKKSRRKRSKNHCVALRFPTITT